MLQIESIVLYHRTLNASRVLPLTSGLNVVTGWRNTGKSSIIEIIDYCFGRETLHVSEGKVRTTVGWYGLVLRNRDKFAFIGRPTPKEGKTGSTEGLFLPLSSPTPPDRGALQSNCLVDQLRDELSSFAGFADTQFVPPDGASRPALNLHIGHALPISMQDEEDIISKSRLFHRGEEREVMQALRDTFPYMVGATDADAPLLRAQLSALRTDLRQIERDLTRLDAAEHSVDERAIALLTLAQQTGLAPESDVAGAQGTLDALRAATAQDPESPAAYVATGDAERLLEQRRQLNLQLRRAEQDLSLLQAFGQDHDAFSIETNEQRARLATLGLVGDNGQHDSCPVCDGALPMADTDGAKLARQLQVLEQELEGASRMEPRTRAAIATASSAIEDLNRDIRGVSDALNELDREERSARKSASLAARRARVQGLIEEYLRTAPTNDPGVRAKLVERQALVAAQITELEPQVDSEHEQERLEGALDLINADTTAYARRLELEHAAHGQVSVRLSRTTLTITTEDGRTFPLRSIGGGGTRVGYHLAAHLAVHKLLRTRDRPTPAFLILDQPTGPFYPDNVPDGVEPQLSKESDEVIVRGLFELVRDVVAELDGALQVLITDHATFHGEKWFDDALVENWRNGAGLIPNDWIAEA